MGRTSPGLIKYLNLPAIFPAKARYRRTLPMESITTRLTVLKCQTTYLTLLIATASWLNKFTFHYYVTIEAFFLDVMQLLLCNAEMPIIVAKRKCQPAV
jgi:hypothetical protein